MSAQPPAPPPAPPAPSPGPRQPSRRFPLTEIIIAAVAALITGIGGAVGAYAAIGAGRIPNPAPETSSPSSSPTAGPKPTVQLIQPAQGGNPTICTTISGTAELHPGQALAIAAREVAENRWYIDGGLIERQGNSWSINMQLGDPKDKVSRPYEVAALVMPADEVTYLMSTNRLRDVNNEALTFWSSPDLPPTVLAKDVHQVVRQGVAGNCP